MIMSGLIRVGRVFIIALFGLIGLVGILATTDNNVNDTQSYAVAYPVTAGGLTTYVRWSEDGLSWSQGGKLNGSGHVTGVALAALSNKTMYIAGWKDGERIRLLQGLGTGNWNDQPMSAYPQERAVSPPAVTFMEQGKWVVAFRAKRDPADMGDRMVVRILDTSVSPPRYLDGNQFEYREQDFFTSSTPAVTYVNGKILLAWTTGRTGSQTTIHLATGTYADNEISWQGHTTYLLTEPNCNSLQSNLALSHDHSNFYFGFLCGDQSQPASRTAMYIHRSADGFNWGYYGRWAKGGSWITEQSLIGLAGRADGSLLAAAFKPSTNEEPFVARCNGGDACKESANVQWQSINWQNVFAQMPSGQFSLIATGHPAE